MSDPGDPTQIPGMNVASRTIRLDPGLFALSLPQGPSDPAQGLPAARVSLPPGPSGQRGAVRILASRDDGWMTIGDEPTLLRAPSGGGHAMVTLYWAGTMAPPAMKLERVNTDPSAASMSGGTVPGSGAQGFGAQGFGTPGLGGQGLGGQGLGGQAGLAPQPEIVAHIEGHGDTDGRFGEWVGRRGSGRAIEGFSLTPRMGLTPDDFEIRAVLGRDWLSPWLPGGHFCGSRGLALPLRGFCLRLRSQAAARLDFACMARFVDGSEIGPAGSGQICAAPSFAPLEAFQIGLRPLAA